MLDLEKARATDPKDEERIKQEISKNMGGFQKLNVKVQDPGLAAVPTPCGKVGGIGEPDQHLYVCCFVYI